jgi:hypothetical protein
MQLSKPPKPKATRKRLKKEILSGDFKKRKIFWKNIAENFVWKICHLAPLIITRMKLDTLEDHGHTYVFYLNHCFVLRNF